MLFLRVKINEMLMKKLFSTCIDFNYKLLRNVYSRLKWPKSDGNSNLGQSIDGSARHTTINRRVSSSRRQLDLFVRYGT